MRLVHESQFWKKESLFLTLTYNDENLPENGSLNPDDLTLFLKRVRARLDYQGRPFKYFASGEYGSKENTERPHYHAVVFGLRMSDFEVVPGLRQVKYRIAQWKKGFIDVKPLNFNRARYTAKYILKQGYVYSKAEKQKIVASGGKYPPFRASSQGLGLRWAEAHREELEATACCTINGKKRSVPRYYVKRLELELSQEAILEMEAEKEETMIAEIADWGVRDGELDLYILRKKVQRRKNLEAQNQLLLDSR